MLDLSPEKLMVLLAVGLMVLGPNRLPKAARTLARGLARARQLTATLDDPIRAHLAEPTRVMNEAMADMRDAMRAPTPPPTPVDPNLN
jgi:Sec-independent protein translocase protein TatA